MLTLHINGRPVATSNDFEYLATLYHTTLGGSVFEPADAYVTTMAKFPPNDVNGRPSGLALYEAREARQLYRTGQYTQTDLAAHYGVSQYTLWKAIHGLGAYPL